MKDTIISERVDDRLLTDILVDQIPGIPISFASALSSARQMRKYQPGELIVSEGEASTGVFLLISGTVQAVVSKRTCQTTQRVCLHEMTAPTVLGLSAAMLTQASPVSLVATTPVQTAFIPRSEFLRVLEQFPQAGLLFSQLIANELAHSYSFLRQLRSLRSYPISASV